MSSFSNRSVRSHLSKEMYPSSEKRFLAVNLIAIIALFLLILAGGVVRSTGSGMGCPDWPKCFDRYIPPTHISQLPSNYQEKYVEKRVQKNERFAKTLDMFGYGEMAHRIRNDKSILKPDEFNAAKTWTEYVNRLVGAWVGLLLIACVITSVPYLKIRKRIFYFRLFNLILVGYQGWLGSIVVNSSSSFIKVFTYFSLLITVIQITIGTEVREQIDAISSEINKLNRGSWVEQVGTDFIIHRDLAFLVLILNGISFGLILRFYPRKGYQYKYISYVLLLAFMQIMTGVVLSYLALPPFAQAVHILLATMLFGCQFYLLLLLKPEKLSHTTFGTSIK